ncbi:hypothetical protein IWX83_000902 [Flavobacterium sp. CG_9.1]|nr:hypothetical protein [Flavobacterium sp. CG_9.1]MBG6061126.1 hypothetical protein [Flavobacterium sp. CG_9.1]
MFAFQANVNFISGIPNGGLNNKEVLFYPFVISKAAPASPNYYK